MDHPSFSIGEEFQSVEESSGGQKKKQDSIRKSVGRRKKSQPKRKVLQSLDVNSVVEKPVSVVSVEQHVNEQETVEAPPLPIDFIDSDSDFEEEPGRSGRSRKRGFLEIDDEMGLRLEKNASTKRKDEAYAQRYYEWRRRYGAHFGASTCPKRIQEFTLTEMREFGQHLVYFIQQIVQKNGKPYRATTIKDFLITFGRLLREGRKTRIQETGMDEPDINIFAHPFFAAAANRVIAKIIAAQPRKQRLNLINDDAALKILSSDEFSLSTPKGLLNRVMFYCMVNFLIRGSEELYKTRFVEFELVEDHYGRFVRFLQKPSKNRPGNLNNCKESDMRKPVEVYEHINVDVYRTFTEYFSRLPSIGPNEDISERHLLLAAKNCIAGGNGIWYANGNLGINKVQDVGKTMTNILGFRVSNVCLRHYAITKGRMQGIPDDNLKDLTGHKRVETLRNYDHSDKQLMMAMQTSLKVGGESYNSAYSSLRQNLREPEKNIEMPVAIGKRVLALGERDVWKSQFEEIEEVSKVIGQAATDTTVEISEVQDGVEFRGMQGPEIIGQSPPAGHCVTESVQQHHESGMQSSTQHDKSHTHQSEQVAGNGGSSFQHQPVILAPSNSSSSSQHQLGMRQNPAQQFGAPIKGFTFSFTFN